MLVALSTESNFLNNPERVQYHISKKLNLKGRYSSVDLSAPTILRSRVRIYPYIVKFCAIFVIALGK